MQVASANQPDIEAVEMWKLAVRSMAQPLLTYESAAFDGFTALWGGALFPLTNHLFLDSPLRDIEQLDRMVKPGASWATERELPWLWSMCEPWLPEGGPQYLERHGLQRFMTLTYMTAGGLAPPVRELPRVEMRAVDSADLALVVSDLNCEAYGMPADWGRSANAGGQMWLEDAIGFVAFVDDEPVSTATVIPTAGRLNVVCVATASDHRNNGYAEAVMRHTLAVAEDITGLDRTVLHATDAGFTIYKRMGYTPGVQLGIWSPEQH
jgi:GNAT superfamily N-acetyltransferase